MSAQHNSVVVVGHHRTLYRAIHFYSYLCDWIDLCSSVWIYQCQLEYCFGFRRVHDRFRHSDYCRHDSHSL